MNEIMTREEFLQKNMLGFGEKHKKIEDFLGDYVAVSISDSIIVLETQLAPGKSVKKSTHCGLTKEEMEVMKSHVIIGAKMDPISIVGVENFKCFLLHLFWYNLMFELCVLF